MVVFPPVHDAQIVVGGDHIDHVAVYIHSLLFQHVGNVCALPDHGRNMVQLVRLVKMGVARQNVALNVLFQLVIHSGCKDTIFLIA